MGNPSVQQLAADVAELFIDRIRWFTPEHLLGELDAAARKDVLAAFHCYASQVADQIGVMIDRKPKRPAPARAKVAG